MLVANWWSGGWMWGQLTLLTRIPKSLQAQEFNISHAATDCSCQVLMAIGHDLRAFALSTSKNQGSLENWKFETLVGGFISVWNYTAATDVLTLQKKLKWNLFAAFLQIMFHTSVLGFHVVFSGRGGRWRFTKNMFTAEHLQRSRSRLGRVGRTQPCGGMKTTRAC